MFTIDANKIKKIYFVGIKGVGMTALSLIAKQAGFEVRGSDVSEEFITDHILNNAGIGIDIGFDPELLEKFIGGIKEEVLVVTTAAHGGLENPQSVYARSNHIEILTHGQALGYFMSGEILNKSVRGISVLGCHGKTTITAMIATALSVLEFDPSYAVGTSELFPLGNPGKLGSGSEFVAEADEFVSDVKHDKVAKFLYQFPTYAIINNIDFDHPDVYKDLEDVIKTFETFCLTNIQEGGSAIINGDDTNLLRIKSTLLAKREDIKIITYGENERNDIRILNFQENGWSSSFEVNAYGSDLGKFQLFVPGFHNAKNSLSQVALLLQMGVNPLDIKKATEAFLGTKRRQEKVGVTKNGSIVLDDYAHHPDEIRKTLLAVKKAFPDKSIVCLFQPHTLSRTESLWKEFSQAFFSANQVLFLPIFTSKREGDADYTNLYENIKNSMQEMGTRVEFLKDERVDKGEDSSPYLLAKNRLSVVEYIHSKFDSKEWVVVTLGAGDVYRIAYDLVKKEDLNG